jgi:hypothetical protein
MKGIFDALASSIGLATGACATVATAAGGGPVVDQANATTRLARPRSAPSVVSVRTASRT